MMKVPAHSRKFFIASLIGLSLIGLSTLSYATKDNPDDPISLLLQKLKAWTKKSNIEKVHLHLDKSHYNVGDHIWFKAIVTEFETLAPTQQSEVLYVDLYNERDSLENKAILKLTNGVAWGQFYLADELNEGNYRIRAYTNWMRNAGPDFYFSKNIKIGSPAAGQIFVQTTYRSEISGQKEVLNAQLQFKNSLNQNLPNLKVAYQLVWKGKNLSKGSSSTDNEGRLSINIPSELKESFDVAQLQLSFEQYNRTFNQVLPIQAPNDFVDVLFFPESGHLVAGHVNRIAFKALNALGKGKDVSGEILDETGALITTFESAHLGMGSFFLLPVLGKNYSAKIKLGENQYKSFSLPKLEENGYILQVTNANVRVLLSESMLGKGKLTLLVHQNGREFFSSPIPNDKIVAQISLATEDMISGISTISLLNEDLIPVAERLVFVENELDFMDINAKNLKSNYLKKEKVDLNFSAQMKQGLTDGTFSVAVTNTLNYLPDSLNESHIYSSLLLESDIKGLVEQPNYYFQKENALRIKALDHLLLTQGWRKIDWQSLKLGNDINSHFAVEKDLKVEGLVQPSGLKPVANARVILMTNLAALGLDTLTNAKGEFIFDRLHHQDSTTFLFQAKNAANSPIEGLSIKPQFEIDKLSQAEILEKTLNFQSWEKILERKSGISIDQEAPSSLKGSIRLKTVNINKAVENKAVILRSSNLNGVGKADIIITAKEVSPSQTLGDVIIARAGSLIAPTPNINDQPAMPMLIVDGMPFEYNPYYAPSINRYKQIWDSTMPNLASIEILKSPMYLSMYGSRAANGVIIVNTRTGDDFEEERMSKSTIQKYLARGFHIPKQFYQSNIEASDSNAKLPDNRITVYWNPSVVSDQAGNFSFSYVNPDQAGSYRMVIEGINLNGEILRKVYYYRVD